MNMKNIIIYFLLPMGFAVSGCKKESFSYLNSEQSKSTDIAACSDCTPSPTQAPPEAIDIPTISTFSTNEDQALEVKLVPVDKIEIQHLKIITNPNQGALKVVSESQAKILYTPNGNFQGSDSLTIQLTPKDRTKFLTTEKKIQISVLPINDAPVFKASDFVTAEDSVLENTFQAQVTDTDDTDLQFQVITKPDHGNLIVDQNSGKFRFTPSENFFGKTIAQVQVSDGKMTAIGAVSFTVTPINDGPVARNGNFIGTEDKTIGQMNLLSFVSDIDSSNLVIKIISPPSKGVLSEVSPGNFQFTPPKDFYGTLSFVYEVSDGFLKDTGNIQIVINQENDAPGAQPLALEVLEDSILRGIDLAAVSTDADGDALAISISQGPKNGLLRLAANSQSGIFDYQPNQDFNGKDSFTYVAKDQQSQTQAQVAIAVKPVNDPPTVKEGQISVKEDSNETLISLNQYARDIDSSQLSFRITRQPLNGILRALDQKSLQFGYKPKKDFSGEDELQFEVSDGQFKETGLIKINVESVNDCPVVQDLVFTVDEQKILEARLLASDVDSQPQDIRYSIVKPEGFAGNLNVDTTSGTFTFVSSADVLVPQRFDYVAKNLAPECKSSPGHVQININDLNTSPVVDNLNLTVKEKSSVEGDLVFRDNDPQYIVFNARYLPAHGEATVDRYSGKIRYTPNLDYKGFDQFEVEAIDRRGRKSQPATVKIEVKEATPEEKCASPLFTKHLVKNNIAFEGNNPDKGGQRCPWGQGDNLSKKNGKTRARLEWMKELAPEFTGPKVCSLKINTPGDQKIRYDDRLLFALNDVILFAAFSPGHFQTGQLPQAEGLYKYLWFQDNKGIRSADSDNGDQRKFYSVVDTFELPFTETKGNIRFSMDNIMTRKVLRAAENPEKMIFKLVVTGDNNKDTDCAYTPFSLEVEAQVLD